MRALWCCWQRCLAISAFLTTFFTFVKCQCKQSGFVPRCPHWRKSWSAVWVTCWFEMSLSEWVSVPGSTSHSTHNRSFWKRVFPGSQLIALVLTTKRQWNETLNAPWTQNRNRKNCPSKRNKVHPDLVWLLRPLVRKQSGPILTAPEPTWGLKCFDSVEDDTVWHMTRSDEDGAQCPLYACKTRHCWP